MEQQRWNEKNSATNTPAGDSGADSPATVAQREAVAPGRKSHLEIVESIEAPGTPACEITILMPCLNEARTLGNCIRIAQKAIADLGVRGEVLIADNGSTDGSVELALAAGARVVNIKTRGYGAALLGGIEAARGEFILMGDADESYDFSHLDRFLAKLREGYDLVMGNRFKGGIEPHAMPFLHRYLGNPGLSAVGKLFFHSNCNDFYCGLRGFRRDSIRDLKLISLGMEFAHEMVVKSTLFGLKVVEVPTTLKPDGRGRAPHLRTWRDGWRTLRFLLLYSPKWLFFYPGVFLMCAGLAVNLWLLPGPQRVGQVNFDLHTMLYAAMAILIGFECLTFAAYTKIFAMAQGLLPEDARLSNMFRVFTLERGLILGLILFAAGIAVSIGAVVHWRSAHFGNLNFDETMRLVIPGAVSCVLGAQMILSSFFMGILGLARRR
jgi:glycosyltransferase involved in cell wall biosynthesis